MKPAAIAITSIAGTLGIAAAIGFAQPDGLQPPAGPVADTQPSLSTIEAMLAGIGGDSEPSTVVQFRDLGPGAQVQIEAGTIRVERVIMQKGSVVLEDAAGTSLLLEASRITTSGGSRFQGAFASELNTDLVSPITITGENTLNNADFIVVYKELP